MHCTCIIPFFNEAGRIEKVLDQVVKVSSIDEIICIDDGSTDGAVASIRKRYPKVTILTHRKNVGKTEAIKMGLVCAKGDYILLFDADLQNVRYQEIEHVLQKAFTNDVDMVIMRRLNEPYIMQIARGDMLLSGERILRKKDLIELLQEKHPKGFQLEFAINQYMMEHKKKVFWMPSSALNTYPPIKRGLVKGVKVVVQMQINILSYIGLYNMTRQILFFCTKELV